MIDRLRYIIEAWWYRRVPGASCVLCDAVAGGTKHGLALCPEHFQLLNKEGLV